MCSGEHGKGCNKGGLVKSFNFVCLNIVYLYTHVLYYSR